jgi:hypothetical protein
MLRYFCNSFLESRKRHLDVDVNPADSEFRWESKWLKHLLGTCSGSGGREVSVDEALMRLCAGATDSGPVDVPGIFRQKEPNAWPTWPRTFTGRWLQL